MIAKEHLDADSEKTADFRHERILAVSAKRLLASTLLVSGKSPNHPYLHLHSKTTHRWSQS